MNIFEIPEPENREHVLKRSEKTPVSIENDSICKRRTKLQQDERTSELKDKKNLAEVREEISHLGERGQRETEKNIEKLKRDWEKFYQETFVIRTDLSQVEVPERREGFERLIIMAEGITSQQLIEKCKEYFAVSESVSKEIGGDFEGVIISQRSCSQKSYAVLVQDIVEASAGELKDFSANDVDAEKITTETLKERLMHELKYFIETGKHLDLESVTICSGSRLPDGKVPTVGWLGGKVLIVSAAPDVCAGNWQAREVIS